MNLMLLHHNQIDAQGYATIEGRAAEHAFAVLRAQVGGTINIGVINGKIGQATIHALTKQNITIQVLELNTAPPPTLNLKLLLGLPRPRMLHRLFQTVATMGVDELHLIQTARVEKSFWQTPVLQPHAVQEQLILGLEQGKATQLPQVHFHKRLRPFMEDTLPTLIIGAKSLVAHPCPNLAKPQSQNQKTVLAIGPEGGFINNEVNLFSRLGFEQISLGERILKVETAVAVALAKLF